MNRAFSRPLKMILASLVVMTSASAYAHGDVSCPAMPKEEMKPQMELQKQLTDKGWKVRQVKNFNGCYEVYGFDDKGNRVEVFFNPKTFELVNPAPVAATPVKP